MIPIPKQRRPLLEQVQVANLIAKKDLYHLGNAVISIQQDVFDQVEELFLPQKQLRYALNLAQKELAVHIREMQKMVGDEQLLTLQNNECMKMVLKKVIECTKNGTIEDLCNTILDFENK